MSFTRRFQSPPTQAVETAIEGVNVVELAQGGNVLEVLEGIAVGVGETLAGPYGVVAGPVAFQPNSVDDFENQFGGYSPYLGVAGLGYGSATTAPTQGGPNGNLFVAFRGKNFVQNMISRVDLRCVNATGTTTNINPSTGTYNYIGAVAPITFTVTSAAANASYIIPGGTRISSQAMFFAPSTTSGDGVLLTAVATGTGGNAITFATTVSGAGTTATVTVTGNAISVACNLSVTNTILQAALAASPAATALVTATVVAGGGDVVLPAAIATSNLIGGAVLMPDNNITITTNGSGNGTGTANLVNVSGLFPGQPNTVIAAGGTGGAGFIPSGVGGYTGGSAKIVYPTSATWTILDTVNLPTFGSATSASTQAPNSPIYTALTTANTVVTNTTAIYPYLSGATTPVDAYDTAYQLAINACDTTAVPGSTADLIFSAFAGPDEAIAGSTIGQAVWSAGLVTTNILAHLTAFRSHGKGRVGVVMGQQGDTPTAAVAATNKNYVNGAHSSWLVYAYPWVLQSVPEASAILTVQPNAWVACAMANVNPEANPGQLGLPAIQAIQGLEANIQPVQNDYINLKAAGIAAFFISPQTGVEIESGITMDNVTPTTIKNQRFRDFLEDTLAGYLAQYIKQLQTQERKANLVGKLQSYLSGLLSQEDPTQQRINAYNLDAISGNTTNLIGLGVFRVKVAVQQIDDFRNIDLLMDVGESVIITSQ